MNALRGSRRNRRTPADWSYLTSRAKRVSSPPTALTVTSENSCQSSFPFALYTPSVLIETRSIITMKIVVPTGSMM